MYRKYKKGYDDKDRCKTADVVLLKRNGYSKDIKLDKDLVPAKFKGRK